MKWMMVRKEMEIDDIVLEKDYEKGKEKKLNGSIERERG